MPTQLLKQPIGTQTKLKEQSRKVLPLHILNNPQNQSPVSISYKLAIWIYVVRPFQTPHTLFYQGLFD